MLATSTIFERLGWGGGTVTKVVAAAVVAALIVSASVAGYHVIMRLQAVLTWVTGAVSILYVVMTARRRRTGTPSARSPRARRRR